MRRASLPDFSARQLEAVLALAEYGSFVAAAARLRLSQPTLTRAIKRLETALGVRLFDRSTRRVQITAAGREFAAVAERMLNDLGITVQSVREVAEERRGLVVLSTIMSVAGGRLPSIVAAYRADRPGVEIHIREGVHATVLEDVRSGVADFGIGYVDELPDFVGGTALGSVHSGEATSVWVIGMRYKILDANSTEQVANGYFEEKMELGATSTQVAGVSRRATGQLTLDTLVQRLVQKSVAEIDARYK